MANRAKSIFRPPFVLLPVALLLLLQLLPWVSCSAWPSIAYAQEQVSGSITHTKQNPASGTWAYNCSAWELAIHLEEYIDNQVAARSFLTAGSRSRFTENAAGFTLIHVAMMTELEQDETVYVFAWADQDQFSAAVLPDTSDSQSKFAHALDLEKWDDVEAYVHTLIESSNDVIYGLTQSSSLPELPPPSALKGDANGDGVVDVRDAILILRHVAGLIDMGEGIDAGAPARARVSGVAGPIDVADAILILRYVIGLFSDWPDGEPGDENGNGPGDGPGDGTGDDPGEWLELREGNLAVFYKAGYEEDAENVLDWAVEAVAITQQYYPHEPVEIVEIYLHHPDEWNYSSGYATADPWYGPQPQMHFLAPSAHNSWRDEHWWRSNITHEYVHIPTATHNQEMGYQDGPFWLIEGVAMYIPAVGLPPSDNPQHQQARLQDREYIRNMLELGRGYLDDLGISYAAATYVAQFMVNTWGWETYGSLFRSPAATFEGAVLNILMMDLAELEQEWLAWACEEFEVDPAIYAEGRPPAPAFPDEPVEGTWNLAEPLWVLTSDGISFDDIRLFLQEADMWSAGMYGGSIDYIAPGLSGYRGNLEWSNTLLIYIHTAEPLSAFEIWPEEFNYLIPLELDRLADELDSAPFIYLRECTYGLTRAILVATNAEQALAGLEHLINNDTPLNILVSYLDLVT